MREMGFDRSNSFDVIHWDFADGLVSGSNAYYTLFNHGGPHVDAPNHIGLERGVDSYAVEVFSGPLKVFDVSTYPLGRTVPSNVFRGQGIQPGDIVLIYTAYTPPQNDKGFPETVALMPEAAEYLASIPVGAFGTDAFSVANLQAEPAEGDSALARFLPNHNAFLSRGIPIYESLFNVERLLGKENLYFTGAPLNIRDGDGMMVRPLVFVY
jgi:kynurenine formamidase